MTEFSQPRMVALDFPMVADEERSLRQKHDRKIAELEAARGVCTQIAALEGDGRFRLWVAHIEELARRAEQELRTANEPFALARAQGKVQALVSIVGVVKAADSERQALALALLEEHDRASKSGILKPGPIHPSGGIWSDHGRHEQREQGRGDGGERS